MHPLKATKAVLLSQVSHPPPPAVSADVLAVLAAAVSKFEGKFASISDEVIFGPSSRPNSHAPTGERYQEFITSRRDGFQDAIDEWLTCVWAEVPETPSTLYWRIRPEINHFPRSRQKAGGWAIYSRFLISDKPRKF